MIGAEHQAKLHGGLCSLLCHWSNGLAVSKAVKIKNKLQQILREEPKELAEKCKTETTDFENKEKK